MARRTFTSDRTPRLALSWSAWELNCGVLLTEILSLRAVLATSGSLRTANCTFPDCIADTMEDSSGMIRYSTLVNFGAPLQCVGFAASVIDWLGLGSLRGKGPVPSGFVLMDCSVAPGGRIAMLMLARFAGSAASGADRVSVTVCASVAVIAVTEASELRATAAVAWSLMVSSEYFTAAESKGAPLAKVAPVRRWKVMVLPSAEVSHDWARPGTTLRSLSNSVSVPYRF